MGARKVIAMNSQQRVAKLWYIKNMNFFKEFTTLQLGELERLSKMRVLGRNEVIYMEGDPADSVFLLKQGRVSLSMLVGDREVTLAILGPGEIFGELIFNGEEFRECTALALDNTVICTIRRRDFESLIRSHPDLAFKIIKLMGLKLRRIEGRLEELLYADVPTRLARLLVRLEREYGVPSDGGVALKLSLTHEELARLVGSTRVTVTFALKELRSAGLLEVNPNRRIVIKDHGALERKAFPALI